MKGFFNKILRINLKTKTFKEETIPDSVYETYLGGKGLGTHLLMKEILLESIPFLQTTSSSSAQARSPILESMVPAAMVSSQNLPSLESSLNLTPEEKWQSR